MLSANLELTMKIKSNIFRLLVLIAFLTSCQGKKAIELVKETKVSSDLWSLGLLLRGAENGGLTWNSWCNSIAKESPNNKWNWTSNSTDESGIYVVHFTDEDDFGYHWEVDISNEIVIYVNNNDYLNRKYGFNRLDDKRLFEISSIKYDSLRFFKKGHQITEIDYRIECSLINRTNKKLTSAEISGSLKVIFKDKTVEGKSTYYSGFKIPVNSYKPWNPDSERKFTITTKSIEGIYASYQPEYVFFELELQASDPVGFSYNRNVIEKDLITKWRKQGGILNNGKLYDYYETIETTNFYSEPSTKSKKLGYLKKGLNVGGIALVDTRWIKVKTKENDGYVEIKSLKPKK